MTASVALDFPSPTCWGGDLNNSHQAFNDGDNVVLRDADGKRYLYKVFDEFVVEPNQTEVTEPVAGKNIVSLQACTLPDYSKRLIIQAELVEVLEDSEQAGAAR